MDLKKCDVIEEIYWSEVVVLEKGGLFKVRLYIRIYECVYYYKRKTKR